jgi:Flp pilus assembly protein TadD
MNPLPEYQWTLAEALRATGRADEAGAVESQLRRHGAVTDPRTFALFLATRGAAPQAAVRLAKAELNNRQDIFTHDALGWALAAAGDLNEATVHISQALAEGTQDPRLFLHAGIIYAKSGRIAEADRNLSLASGLAHLLLPSERNLLTQSLSSLQGMRTELNNVNQQTNRKELVQHD